MHCCCASTRRFDAGGIQHPCTRPPAAPTKTKQVGPWTSQIIEAILKKLAVMGRPYKYICHLTLTQRCGAGLHAAATTRWNPKTDGQLSV